MERFFRHDWPSQWDGPPLTDALISTAERRLGVRLPAAYVALLRERNGGWARLRHPKAPCFGFKGVGSEEGVDALQDDGRRLNDVLIANWGFPRDSVVLFCHHGGLCLDYGPCGPDGEPCVVWVNAEYLPTVRIETVAPDFATFLDGLTEPIW